MASYKEKGLSDKDAATIVETMAKYEEVRRGVRVYIGLYRGAWAIYGI